MVCFFFCGSQSKNYSARKLNRGRNRKDVGGEKKGEGSYKTFARSLIVFFFVLGLAFAWLNYFMHQSVVFLQDGKGGGREGVAGTHGKLAFSGCQFSHPWVSIMSQINAPAAN